MPGRGVVPDEPTWGRIERALPLVERYLPPRPDLLRRDPPSPDKRMWFKCLPDSASVGEAPAYGVIKIVGSEFIGGHDVLKFEKPDTDSLQGCAILWAHNVPASGDDPGWCTFEPAHALYNDASTPAWDEAWGTEANTWKLKKDNTGFKILGGASEGRVLVKRPERETIAWGFLSSSASQTLDDGNADTQISFSSGAGSGIEADTTGDMFVIQTAGTYLFGFWCSVVEGSGASGLLQPRFFFERNGTVMGEDIECTVDADDNEKIPVHLTWLEESCAVDDEITVVCNGDDAATTGELQARQGRQFWAIKLA